MPIFLPFVDNEDANIPSSCLSTRSQSANRDRQGLEYKRKSLYAPEHSISLRHTFTCATVRDQHFSRPSNSEDCQSQPEFSEAFKLLSRQHSPSTRFSAPQLNHCPVGAWSFLANKPYFSGNFLTRLPSGSHSFGEIPSILNKKSRISCNAASKSFQHWASVLFAVKMFPHP